MMRCKNRSSIKCKIEHHKVIHLLVGIFEENLFQFQCINCAHSKPTDMKLIGKYANVDVVSVRPLVYSSFSHPSILYNTPFPYLSTTAILLVTVGFVPDPSFSLTSVFLFSFLATKEHLFKDISPHFLGFSNQATFTDVQRVRAFLLFERNCQHEIKK